jgi:Single-strand binding protein family
VAPFRSHEEARNLLPTAPQPALTREPDSRNTPNGTPVVTMRVAIDRPGDGADYVNVTAFGKLAKSC